MIADLDEKARLAAWEWMRPRYAKGTPVETLDSLAAAFKAFAEESREEERRMVVGWLRERVRGENPYLLHAAEVIERGDHRPTQGEKREGGQG